MHDFIGGVGVREGQFNVVAGTDRRTSFLCGVILPGGCAKQQSR